MRHNVRGVRLVLKQGYLGTIHQPSSGDAPGGENCQVKVTFVSVLT